MYSTYMYINTVDMKLILSGELVELTTRSIRSQSEAPADVGHASRLVEAVGRANFF